MQPVRRDQKIFQADYVSSFQQADLVVIKGVEARALDKNDDLFDVSVVCQEISNAGIEARSFDRIDEIVNFLVEKVQKNDDFLVKFLDLARFHYLVF